MIKQVRLLKLSKHLSQLNKLLCLMLSKMLCEQIHMCKLKKSIMNECGKIFLVINRLVFACKWYFKMKQMLYMLHGIVSNIYLRCTIKIFYDWSHFWKHSKMKFQLLLKKKLIQQNYEGLSKLLFLKNFEIVKWKIFLKINCLLLFEIKYHKISHEVVLMC